MLGLLQTKIQTGRTTGGNITIEAVADTSKCIVIVDGGATGYLTDNTTLAVSRDTNNTNGVVSWTIVELGGAVPPAPTEITIQRMVAGNDYSKSNSVNYTNSPSMTFKCNYPGVVNVAASAVMATGNPSPVGVVDILKNGQNIATSGSVTINTEKTLSASITINVDVNDTITIKATETQGSRDIQVKKLSGSVKWSVQETTYPLNVTVEPNSMWS